MHASSGTAQGGPLVLVVDDSDWVRDVLAAWLRREGFSVQLAADGPEAVEQYQRTGARFAVALVDKHMPGWDGLHTIAHLKRLDPGLPCCLMSGDAQSEVAKPFRWDELRWVLRNKARRFEAACR